MSRPCFFPEDSWQDIVSLLTVLGFAILINLLGSVQGWRPQMEDEFIMSNLSIDGHCMLGVFDGHAGRTASKYAAENLIRCLEDTEDWKAYLNSRESIELLERALVKAFISLDEELFKIPALSDGSDTSGTAAVVAVLTPSHIVCANLGDSRCALRTRGSCVALSEDHKPSLPEEAHRIYTAGGHVELDRVDGELALSRALGDFRYKGRTDLSFTEQKVICVPDVSSHSRSSEDEILLLACDGLFDVISTEEAVELAHNLHFHDSHKPDAAASEMVDLALSLGSSDNVSVIVVPLKSAMQ